MINVRACAVVWLLGCLALYSPGAFSQGQGDDMALAKEMYSKGQAAFDQDKFAEALEAFEGSMGAFPHYRTIFNIALCHEKMGNIAEAVEKYQRYVDWPSEVPNREEIAAKISELKELLPPEPEPVEESTEAGPVDGTDPAPEPQPKPEPGPNLVVPGWISIGAGAGGVVLGGIMLGMAQRKASEMRAVDGEVYKPNEHEAIIDKGKTFEKVGWISGGIGLAAVAAGTVMLLVSDSSEKEEEPVEVVYVGPSTFDNGGGVAAAWSF